MKVGLRCRAAQNWGRSQQRVPTRDKSWTGIRVARPLLRFGRPACVSQHLCPIKWPANHSPFDWIRGPPTLGSYGGQPSASTGSAKVGIPYWNRTSLCSSANRCLNYSANGTNWSFYFEPGFLVTENNCTRFLCPNARATFNAVLPDLDTAVGSAPRDNRNLTTCDRPARTACIRGVSPSSSKPLIGMPELTSAIKTSRCAAKQTVLAKLMSCPCACGLAFNNRLTVETLPLNTAS